VRPTAEVPSVACATAPDPGWSLRWGSAPVDDAVHDATALLTGPLDDSALDNDELEWQGGRVYLHLGARRDDPPRG
jgi:hypothetical protein